MTKIKINSVSPEEEWKKSFENNVWYTIPSFASVKRAGRKGLVKLVVSLLKDKTNPLVLETGCGSAIHSFALAWHGIQCIPLDYSPDIVKSVEKNIKRFFSEGRPVPQNPVMGNIKDLSQFKDNTFDLVFNEGVMEHFLERQTRINIYKEFLRILKPGGFLLISIPNDKHPLYPFWVWWAKTFKTGFLSFIKGGPLSTTIYHRQIWQMS